ncbi:MULTISPECIES: ArsC/Spx/MgsR family protein [unclassified Ruegeria]|uniref:ArsC/Spx/MgsR family protein n=1 Tax=unclassified Ruegeria TaxID=2625375 RepID=UPI00148890BF|nr:MULTISPECIES: ArsC/Spx/MgsR family protein [unclassified Ruegeria]NOD35909.1 arsenate reductase [Ruegeria sp. HKCCD7296]NOD47082.1 arsenate reductase [Ruegeria sp. HKCCD5849]NOD51405.1 arsenate reductase [Ruegeria sp. HKCCD5851]NOD68225.1 arsenate reductase [Ruegeria sp. HKCCD7303]NOE33292.1 arsenate reductase [Ruegeria sp. HKCCD7318]
MKLYGLKTCDTCRKALKSLPDAELVDVRQDGVPGSVLSQAFVEFGNALLNTRSTTWRGLDQSQREKAPMELLKEHPTLMKRPLIEKDGKLLLGWTAETRTQLGIS